MCVIRIMVVSKKYMFLFVLTGAQKRSGENSKFLSLISAEIRVCYATYSRIRRCGVGFLLLFFFFFFFFFFLFFCLFVSFSIYFAALSLVFNQNNLEAQPHTLKRILNLKKKWN